MAATTAVRRPRLAGWLAAAGWFIFTRERRAGRAATDAPRRRATRWPQAPAGLCTPRRASRRASGRFGWAGAPPSGPSRRPPVRGPPARARRRAAHAMEATLQSCGPVAACGLQTAAGVLAPFENWRGLSGAGGAGRCGAPLAGGRATWCPVRRLG